jgi:hypothetical protein
MNPRIAAPKLPKWVWSHDPEAYAYENYDKAAHSEKLGTPMEEENQFEPNYPKGYRYEKWSIEEVLEKGEEVGMEWLGSGDWD